MSATTFLNGRVRLITPTGGVTLDPFAGTGTSGEAAWREGFSAILIERESEYQADIARRMKYAVAGPDERRHAVLKAKGKVESAGPLFGDMDTLPRKSQAEQSTGNSHKTDNRPDWTQAMNEAAE